MLQKYERFFPVLSQSTRLTDGQTEFSSLDGVCILCSAVKTSQVKTRTLCVLFSLKRLPVETVNEQKDANLRLY